MQQENVLYTSRTHPKILFKAAVSQIILLAALALTMKYLPDNTSVKEFNDYGFLAILAVLLCLEIGLVILPSLRWWYEVFTLTDRRVKNNWGILYKNSREIDLTRIVSISEERGILDRIFGCGTLIFYDPAANLQSDNNHSPSSTHGPGNGIQFHDVPNIRRVREMIEQAKYNAEA